MVINVSKLLTPRGSQQYQAISDYLTMLERQSEIDQGGGIFNPQTYLDLANKAMQASRASGLNANQKRDLYNKALLYQVKALDLQKDKLKNFDTKEIESWLNEDINQLAYEVPGDPYRFAKMAYEAYTTAIDGGKTESGEWPGLNKVIELLRDSHTDVSGLVKVLDKWVEERSMYADIKNAFEKNPERLENYVVVYTPSRDGRVMSMEIRRKTDMSEPKGIDSNLKFTKDGIGSYESTGLRIRFVDPQITTKEGKFVNFAGVTGKLTPKGGEAGQDIFVLPEFKPSDVKKEPIHNLPPGTFLKDTTGKYYYVRKDGVFAPIANEYTLEQLGVKSKPVYQMTKQDEVNLKAATIGNPIDLQARSEIYEEYKNSAMKEYEELTAKSRGFLGTIKKMVGIGTPGLPSFGIFPWTQKTPAPKIPTEEEAIQQRTQQILRGEY
jgi:hypothetical protein